MQLKRYKLFLKNLQGANNFTSSIASFEVYRRTEAHWLDSADVVVQEDDLKRRLEITLTKQSHWRSRNSVEAFFPLPDLRAVAIVKTDSATRKKTRDRICALLCEIAEYADTAFDAMYDGLTGLLNSRSLEKTIANAVAAKTADQSDDAEIAPACSIALMALDLDHFKQINDSYGHEYGDIVLQCFGRRLEGVLNSIQKESATVLVLEAGRSGGEEFLVVMSGDLSPQRIKDIADQVRAAISDTELPSQSEWNSLVAARTNGATLLPHSSERKVTVSVGLSSLKTATSVNPSSIAAELRREADAALYRAKGGGRNTVRFFPEIRARFGTVIEHHAETNVVTIDIGSQVNVKAGQEFHVYHPDFTGQKGFVYSDGRSKKRLGTYPRISSGRLVVLDVQQEISFCTVAEKNLDRFPASSVLEEIPLGSIAHLLPAEVKASVVEGAHAGELDSYVEAVVKRQNRPIAVVFVLRNIQVLEKARGGAFVNRALASLFEAARRQFPPPGLFCQIEADRIAVAAQIDLKARVDELIQGVLSEAAEKMSNLAEFAAGAFTTGLKGSKKEGDRSNLNPKKALSYARYAAVKLATGDGVVELFSPTTATAVVWNHRSQQRFAEGLADYAVLSGLGIENSRVENQAALCALSLGDSGFALEHLKRAVALEPGAPVFKANLGYTLFRFKEPLEAHKCFAQLHQEHPKHEMDDFYVGAEALAAYAAFQHDQHSVALPQLKALLEKAARCVAAGTTHGKDRITNALAHISSLKEPPEGGDQGKPQAVIDLGQIWEQLLDGVRKVSPFTHGYLVNARLSSYQNGVLVAEFSDEFKDYIPLVENSRNQNLIKAKMQEKGHEVTLVKFV